MGGWVAMLSKKEFQYWDKFVCVCVLCNQCTLALTSRVHTSANAVLMKPFITSSLLNLHEPLSLSRSLALSLTRSLAHSLVFSSVRMCVRTRCSTSWLLCVCGCTISILVVPSMKAALVEISPIFLKGFVAAYTQA